MKRNFKDFIAAYLRYTENHESTERIRKWSIISVVAAALERKVWIDRGYYTLYPNLYVFILAKSGLVKKSTSTAIAVNLLRKLDDINFMSDRLTAASMVTQLSAAYKTFTHDGKEVPHSPLMSYSSELAVTMGEVYGSTIELLTTFYDCVPNDPKTPWMNKAKHESEIKIYGPCLNILGASTKEWLRKCIPPKEMYGGFTSRCVFVVENSPPDKLVAWPKRSEELRDMETRLVEDLDIIHNLSGQISVPKDFVTVFTQWYEYHMREVVAKNEDLRWTGYLSRKADLLLKLSMIRSVTTRNSLDLRVDDLRWAGKELEEIEPEMMLAFNRESDDNKNISDNKIYEYIKAKGTVAEEELSSKYQVMGSKLKVGLRRLVEKDLIKFSFKDGTAYYHA